MRNGRSTATLALRVARSSTIAFAAFGCTVGLAVTSTIPSAPTLLANALVMGGTFTPTPDQAEVDRDIADFINPTVNPNLLPIQGSTVTYPASAGIASGLDAPTINQSVAIGVGNLDSALASQELAHPGRPIVVFSYSQSTVVSMIEKANLEDRKARGEAVPDVTFVGIGVGNRPNGGIANRLKGLTIPVFDFTFNGPAPTDPEFGFTTIDIAREYDGLADFPLYPVNLLADLNAVLGVVFVHARYDEVSLDPHSPKYAPGTVKQQYGDTTYYQIPTADLPLFDVARLVGVPEALIDVVEPVTKVIVDAGYDRSIPFGEPTPLRLVPALDPVKLTAEMVAAVGTGVGNALRLIAPVPANGSSVARAALGDQAQPTGSFAPSLAAVPESGAPLASSTSSAITNGAAHENGTAGKGGALDKDGAANTNEAAPEHDSDDTASSTKASTGRPNSDAPHQKPKLQTTSERNRMQEHATRTASLGAEAEDGNPAPSPKETARTPSRAQPRD